MTNRQALSISLEDTPALDDVRFVQQGLQTYNLLYAPDDGYKPLSLFLRSTDGTIFGGLLGETYRNRYAQRGLRSVTFAAAWHIWRAHHQRDILAAPMEVC